VVCSFLGTAANADVLVLNNGDRITGDIKRIWDAEITIEPEYSDEFKVDVAAVAHIESTRELDIELTDGRNMDARLGGTDTAGNQLIQAASEKVAVPLSAIFELNELDEALEWDSNVEVSANINKGNTDTATGKFRADTRLKMEKHRHIGEITLYREELADVSTKEQDLLKYSYNWLFSDPWFFSADLLFESDPIIQLDNRTIASAGVGFDVWDTPRRSLSLKLSPGFQAEEIASVSTDNAVVSWDLHYRQDFFSDDVELFHNQMIVANISGRTNTSYRTSTGLKYEITDLFSANVTLDYDYETKPVDGAKNEDITFLLGIGAEF
jgi:putative salt-induced outer membrane protein YdiY